MIERHLIAYLLLAVMCAGAAYGIRRWRRTIRERRYPGRYKRR